MSEIQTLRRELEYFRERAESLGSPRTPWEQGAANVYGALARGIMERLEVLPPHPQHPPSRLDELNRTRAKEARCQIASLETLTPSATRQSC